MREMNLNLANLRAHTDADGRVDKLGKHLARVAELARQFGSEFGAADFGAVLGILHDIGKALPGFQDYLRRLDSGEQLASGPPHAIWGAALWYALDSKKNAWREMCLPIAGHHAGLAAACELSLSLEQFVQQNLATIEELRTAIANSGLLLGLQFDASQIDGARWSSAFACCSPRWPTPIF